MDRRHGGDPLAPPRPPKLVPHVHRPRAPKPTIMRSVSLQQTSCTTPPVLHQRATQQGPHPLPPQHHQQHCIIQTPPKLLPHNRLLQPQTIPAHSSPPPPPRIPITTPFVPNQAVTQPTPQPTPAPITAPLLLPSIHSGSSTSNRPPPPSLLIIPANSIPSVSSNIHSIDQSPQTPVTLAAPRPENERLANEYVDAPIRANNSVLARIQPWSHGYHGASIAASMSTAATSQTEASFGSSHNQYHHQPSRHIPPPLPPSSSTTISASSKSIVPSSTSSASSNPNQVATSASLLALSATTNEITSLPAIPTSPTNSFRLATRPSALPITKQPMSFGKETVPLPHHHDDHIDQHPSRDGDAISIMCPQCGRCRCEECQRPRELPSRWICDNSCLCSAESIIDYTSCLCCVKALFYHCSKDHETDRSGDSMSCADDPCSCIPHKRTQRWAWLGALSLVLPCLLCYWPMRGCFAFCGKCYARHTRHGCRCSLTQEKKNKASRGTIGGADVVSISPGISLGGSGAGGVLGGPGGVGAGIGRSISRACDLTPEKRLLDSSPEY